MPCKGVVICSNLLRKAWPKAFQWGIHFVKPHDIGPLQKVWPLDHEPNKKFVLIDCIKRFWKSCWNFQFTELIGLTNFRQPPTLLNSRSRSSFLHPWDWECSLIFSAASLPSKSWTSIWLHTNQTCCLSLPLCQSRPENACGTSREHSRI